MMADAEDAGQLSIAPEHCRSVRKVGSEDGCWRFHPRPDEGAAISPMIREHSLPKKSWQLFALNSTRGSGRSNDAANLANEKADLISNSRRANLRCLQNEK